MNTTCPKCHTLIDCTGTAGQSFACPTCGLRLRSPEPVTPPPVSVSKPIKPARAAQPSGPPQWVLIGIGVAAGAMILLCGGCVLITRAIRTSPTTVVAAPPKPDPSKANVTPAPEWTDDEELCLETFKSESLKEFGSSTKIGDVGLFVGPVEVFQVTGNRTFLAKRIGLNLFIIDGVPTGEFIDGKRYEFNDIFLVDGTHRYVTAAGGTKQVLLFRRISTPKVLKVIAEKYAESKKE